MEQNNEKLESLLKRIENGEIGEEEKLSILKELNFSYDVLNTLLDEIKVAKLTNDIKNKI